MNVLDKFAAVEIKAESRLSLEDTAYCRQQQELCQIDADTFRKILSILYEGAEKRNKILRSESEYRYSLIGTRCGIVDVEKALEDIPENFISTLVAHFEEKYKVTLNTHDACERLLPAKPQEPSLRSWHPLTGWESEEAMREHEDYKTASAEYHVRLQNYKLDYEAVVNEIFNQLGGASFDDIGVHELKKAVRSAVTTRDWHNNNAVREEFSVVKNTLRLTGNHCKEDAWFKQYHDEVRMELFDSGKTILRALIHFGIGSLTEIPLDMKDLFDYQFDRAEFPVSSLDSVEHIKLFKNGRMDIRFKDGIAANQFVEQYLRAA